MQPLPQPWLRNRDLNSLITLQLKFFCSQILEICIPVITEKHICILFKSLQLHLSLQEPGMNAAMTWVRSFMEFGRARHVQKVHFTPDAFFKQGHHPNFLSFYNSVSVLWYLNILRIRKGLL